MRQYRSEDNGRWEGFEHRPGDIVISTRSKCGTTWMQMICALLIFQDPELPAPLGELSPWLDWDVEPAESVRARLAGQRHRRFIKTHTPLDGLPLASGVTYIVVGRHPLDVAVSLYHHRLNLDRARMAELSGKPAVKVSDAPLADWVREWVETNVAPGEELDTLAGNVHHIADARRRTDELDVVLVHYQDLADDLAGQMGRLAGHLGISVPEATWPALVEAAAFDSMRDRAERVAPGRRGVLKDPKSFFRSGRSGEGQALLGPEAMAGYLERINHLASREVVAWMHHGAGGGGTRS